MSSDDKFERLLTALESIHTDNGPSEKVLERLVRIETKMDVFREDYARLESAIKDNTVRAEALELRVRKLEGFGAKIMGAIVAAGAGGGLAGSGAAVLVKLLGGG